MIKIILLSFESMSLKREPTIGHNIPQRFHYIDTMDKVFDKNDFIPERYISRAKFLEKRSLFRIWDVLKKYDCIVSERDYLSVFGFLFKMFYGKKWIVDLPDCPFKECTSRYRGKPVKWLISYLKSKVVYFIMRWADAIVVSYSPVRFKKYYRGDLAMAYFFFNALPLNPKPVEYSSQVDSDLIKLIYVGTDFPEYGIHDFVIMMNSYARTRREYKFKLTIVGHIHNANLTADNFKLENHEFLSRDNVIELEKQSDIGVVPFKSGSDIYFTYPIKAIESYFYCKKTLLGNSLGMHDMFDQLDSKDIHFFDGDKYRNFTEKMDIIISQLKNGEFSSKEREIDMFDARKKNMKIKEIYSSVCL